MKNKCFMTIVRIYDKLQSYNCGVQIGGLLGNVRYTAGQRGDAVCAFTLTICELFAQYEKEY